MFPGRSINPIRERSTNACAYIYISFYLYYCHVELKGGGGFLSVKEGREASESDLAENLTSLSPKPSWPEVY